MITNTVAIHPLSGELSRLKRCAIEEQGSRRERDDLSGLVIRKMKGFLAFVVADSLFGKNGTAFDGIAPLFEPTTKPVFPRPKIDR